MMFDVFCLETSRCGMVANETTTCISSHRPKGHEFELLEAFGNETNQYLKIRH